MLRRSLIECGPLITHSKDGKAKIKKQLQKSQAGVELRSDGGTSVPEKPGWSSSSSKKADQEKSSVENNTTTTSKTSSGKTTSKTVVCPRKRGCPRKRYRRARSFIIR